MNKTALLLCEGDFASLFLPSIINRMIKEDYDPIVLTDDESYYFLKDQHRNTFTFDDFTPSNIKFDKLVNFSNTSLPCQLSKDFKSADKNGFYLKDGVTCFYNKGADYYFRTMNLGVPVNHNAFQLFYGLANLTWKGEGYCIKYKTTGGRNKLGLFTDYTLDDCNIQEKFEIIKDYEQIETTSLILAHVGLALKRKIRLILKKDLPYKFELFKSGEVIKHV